MPNDFVSFHINTCDIRDICRCRHELQYCIKKFLNTLVSVCRTAANRNSLASDCSLTKSCLKGRYLRDIAVKILHHKIIIKLTAFLNKLIMIDCRIIFHIIRYICNVNVLSLISFEDVGFHLKQVNNTHKCIFFSYRKLKKHWVLAKLSLNLLYCSVEVRTKYVHLIDISHTRYVVLISLPPYVFRLRLNSALCTEYTYSTIKYTK